MTREELLTLIETGKISTPALECDYELTILNNDTPILIDSFDFPDLGVGFSMSEDLFQYPIPSFHSNTMNINFMVFNNVSPLSVFHSLYESQFTSNGSLKIIPTKERPVFYLSKIGYSNDYLKLMINQMQPYIDGFINNEETKIKLNTPSYEPDTMLALYGCRLTYPKPTISYKSSNVSIYNTQVSFEKFIQR